MRNQRRASAVRRVLVPRPKSLRDLKNRTPEKLTEQLRVFVMNNVLSVAWSSILVIGGIFFLIYFLSIGFFPVLSLSSVATLLAAMAITGLGFIVLLAFYLVFPGWLWREVICEMKEIKPLMFNDAGERQHVFLLHSLPMAIAAASLLNFSGGNSWCWELLFFPPFIVALWKTTNNFQNFGKFLLVAIGNGVVFICTSWFLVLLLASTNKSVPNDSELLSWLFLFGMTFLALFINYLIASSNKIKRWSAFIAGVFLLGSLLLISGQPSMVQQAVLRILKLGSIENAELILDQQACQTTQQFLVSSQSDKSVKASSIKVLDNSSSGMCRLSSINILSRIGEEYYLEQPNQLVRFVVPSSHVLSWSVVEKQAVNKNGGFNSEVQLL